jgi:4-hydroxy-tetrahydrodipicolinate reductase
VSPSLNVADRRLRVFQVATGNVGSEMITRLQHHPDLELIGLHCYSPDKVGKDAGEIVGIEPIGVIATSSIEEIIAAHPDCVTLASSPTPISMSVSFRRESTS